MNENDDSGRARCVGGYCCAWMTPDRMLAQKKLLGSKADVTGGHICSSLDETNKQTKV